MNAKALIGTWALVATEWRRADGMHANPFGANAVGILIYEASGYMSAQVMRDGRASPAEGVAAGIDSAMTSASPGYVAYFGSYVVDEAAQTVTHQIIGSAFPAWVGAKVPRRFAISGNRLTLSDSVVTADGVPAEAETTWERLE